MPHKADKDLSMSFWGSKMLRTVGLVFLLVAVWVTPLHAALRYVDSAAVGAANGTSWTDAWTTMAAITGLSPGDTVYISCGTTGKSYGSPADWQPASGTAGNVITYAVGQDVGHKCDVSGTVTFTRSTSGGTYAFLAPTTARYFTINGEVSGVAKMTIGASVDGNGVSEFNYLCYTTNTADKHIIIKYVVATGSLGWFCYGGYYELAYSSLTAAVNFLTDGSFIAHLGDSGTAGYGINSIHHNVINVWRKRTTGTGHDALKWVTNVDIYNNTFIASYASTFTSGQHNDGMQTSGSYVQVYNNYFENFMSYPIFIDMFADVHDWRIYNNVFKADEAGIDWGAFTAIAIGPDGSSGPADTLTMSNMIIANNTLVGNHTQTNSTTHLYGVHINTGKRGIIGSGMYVVNNLAYDMVDTFSYVSFGGTITNSNNSDSGTANKGFVSNTIYPTNNFNLIASATAAIDLGIQPSYLTDIYTTDAAGANRNAKTLWDLGAYVYGLTPRPDAPTGLVLARASATNPVLIWAPSTDTDFAGYRVYRSLVQGVAGVLVNQRTPATAAVEHSPLTRFIDRLTAACTCYYVVTQYRTDGSESLVSNDVTVSAAGQTARATRQ